MAKQIKDYLHLYLGCKIIAPNPENEKEQADGILTGIHGEYGAEIQFIIDGNALEHPEYADFEKCKPILRKIFSITEEEKKELWRLVFSSGNKLSQRACDFSGRTIFFNETTYYSRPRHVMMQGLERLGIESDCTIWADCDLHTWRHNEHEVTKWLLSKGFDLFELIDSRLAIDKEVCNG